MTRRAVLFVLLAATACGSVTNLETASVARSAPTPSPTLQPTATSPSSPILAIVSGSRTMALIDSNGLRKASWSFHEPAFRPNQAMPFTSASRSRVYFLDSGYELSFVSHDGASAVVRPMAVQPNEEETFSVSPDDQWIAVSVFTYDLPPAGAVDQTPTFAHMQMYVEQLGDLSAAHRSQIFASNTVAEFPIGWVNGHLLVALAKPVCCQMPPLNPYGGSEYHVVDANNGDGLLTLCSAGHEPEGPVEPFGVACKGLGADFYAWDGSALPAPAAIPQPGYGLNAPSPDGRLMAVAQDQISIWGPRGGSRNLPASGTVYGWLDGTHLVIQETGKSSLSLFDLTSDSAIDLSDATEFLGTLPAALS